MDNREQDAQVVGRSLVQIQLTATSNIIAKLGERIGVITLLKEPDFASILKIILVKNWQIII